MHTKTKGTCHSYSSRSWITTI